MNDPYLAGALLARPCRCEVDEPFGDVREGTCQTCGHQVDGKPIPVSRLRSLASVRPAPLLNRPRRHRGLGD